MSIFLVMSRNAAFCSAIESKPPRMYVFQAANWSAACQAGRSSGIQYRQYRLQRVVTNTASGLDVLVQRLDPKRFDCRWFISQKSLATYGATVTGIRSQVPALLAPGRSPRQAHTGNEAPIPLSIGDTLKPKCFRTAPSHYFLLPDTSIHRVS